MDSGVLCCASFRVIVKDDGSVTIFNFVINYKPCS